MNQYSNLLKIQEYFSTLGIEKIGAIFCIPHTIYKDNYVVKYALAFNYCMKLYYIRSHGIDFCITPFSLFKKRENSSLYSIGPGLYQNELHTIILIEVFDICDDLYRSRIKILEFFRKKKCVLNVLSSMSNKYDRTALHISLALA